VARESTIRKSSPDTADAGFTFLDTADTYSAGESEVLVPPLMQIPGGTVSG
jgi:aryl-alcohol dehydrogenase-like predicted oxidoreductase